MATLDQGLAAGYTGGGVLLALTMLWRFQKSFVVTAAARLKAVEQEQLLCERRLDVCLTAMRKAGVTIPDAVWDDPPEVR